MRVLKNRQRGVTLSGLLMVAFVLVIAALLGMKLTPAYVHDAQISQIFQAIAADPAMQNATIKEIKDSYNKRAVINSITEITAEDIEIEKDEGHLSLSANYSVKVPLVANITLLLEFNPSSS
ncbi:MAG TPA: DUF4845 domain-containing protein [Sideroxyarcus sp.]|nr:DUF4845 domain-containing protein [Sideroxyarcus sp.]